MVPKNIKCSIHGDNPWHVVCIHVCMGEVHPSLWKEITVDDGREVSGDYLCGECHEVYKKRGECEELIGRLTSVCSLCLKQVRATFLGEDHGHDEE